MRMFIVWLAGIPAPRQARRSRGPSPHPAPGRPCRSTLAGSARLTNLRQQIARGMIFGIADDGDAPTVLANGVPLRHRVDRVVGPLAVHVGSQRKKQRRDGVLAE